MGHVTNINVSLCPMVSGRARKNIKLIEANTKTAIYFPNMFPGVYGYYPENAGPRQPDQIYITGPNKEAVLQAERMLVDLVCLQWSALSKGFADLCLGAQSECLHKNSHDSYAES